MTKYTHFNCIVNDTKFKNTNKRKGVKIGEIHIERTWAQTKSFKILFDDDFGENFNDPKQRAIVFKIFKHHYHGSKQ